MASIRDVKCLDCPTLVARENRLALCRPCYDARRRSTSQPSTPPTPHGAVAADRATQRLSQELAQIQKKYKESLRTIAEQERTLDADQALRARGATTLRIEPRQGSGTSEATVVLVASDWHMEERVDPATVSGLNTHNLDIAKGRATKFFQGGLRLTRLLQQDVKINHLVLALLGDFISNDIHEDFPENNDCPPTLALGEATDTIASGIEFLLNHSTLQLVIPCHSGNHGRTTRQVRVATENGHSLEFLMYRHLAAHFRHEPRVQFQIAPGYHSYMEIYGKTLRFHHGHEINYAGGVGGIYIPVNKALAQWNKARRADLDVFGHFHQARDGGNFICNGSSIGYNAYALSIKADYEEPRQQLFLMDKRRGRTCTWPILVT